MDGAPRTPGYASRLDFILDETPPPSRNPIHPGAPSPHFLPVYAAAPPTHVAYYPPVNPAEAQQRQLEFMQYALHYARRPIHWQVPHAPPAYTPPPIRTAAQRPPQQTPPTQPPPQEQTAPTNPPPSRRLDATVVTPQQCGWIQDNVQVMAESVDDRWLSADKLISFICRSKHSPFRQRDYDAVKQHVDRGACGCRGRVAAVIEQHNPTICELVREWKRAHTDHPSGPADRPGRISEKILRLAKGLPLEELQNHLGDCRVGPDNCAETLDQQQLTQYGGYYWDEHWCQTLHDLVSRSSQESMSRSAIGELAKRQENSPLQRVPKRVIDTHLKSCSHAIDGKTCFQLTSPPPQQVRVWDPRQCEFIHRQANQLTASDAPPSSRDDMARALRALPNDNPLASVALAAISNHLRECTHLIEGRSCQSFWSPRLQIYWGEEKCRFIHAQVATIKQQGIQVRSRRALIDKLKAEPLNNPLAGIEPKNIENHLVACTRQIDGHTCEDISKEFIQRSRSRCEEVQQIVARANNADAPPPSSVRQLAQQYNDPSVSNLSLTQIRSHQRACDDCHTLLEPFKGRHRQINACQIVEDADAKIKSGETSRPSSLAAFTRRLDFSASHWSNHSAECEKCRLIGAQYLSNRSREPEDNRSEDSSTPNAPATIPAFEQVHLQLYPALQRVDLAAEPVTTKTEISHLTGLSAWKLNAHLKECADCSAIATRVLRDRSQPSITCSTIRARLDQIEEGEPIHNIQQLAQRVHQHPHKMNVSFGTVKTHLFQCVNGCAEVAAKYRTLSRGGQADLSLSSSSAEFPDYLLPPPLMGVLPE